MTSPIKTLREHYSGKISDTVIHVLELLTVAGIVGIITLYGASAEMRGEMNRMCAQLTRIETMLDKHIQDYSIHVPHLPKSKEIR
jgi:hypothetical protein